MAGTKITTTGILYINGVQVENTFTNISKITRKLESELKKLPVGTEAWRKKAEELRTARERFQEVRDEIKGIGEDLDKSGGFLSDFINSLFSFGDTFKSVFAANTASSFFEGFISKGQETIDKLLEIEDAMTDVSKTSGMTHDQVKDLWDAFDEMDTRTGKMDRLKIAEVAGRLGVPLEQMKDFVQEVDKAYVALGDSFEGGLEGVVDQLGKIKGLFDSTKEMSYAEAINRVGSALNTLAASGTASEGNISQFALRMGSLPDALKPALDKVLGLGAAFEEAGIDAQIASSGTSNFLTTAAENIEAFAYSMNMSVTEAKNLINTKPEEFLLRFAAGMKGLNAADTSKVMASLKLNSLEVQKVIGVAANKTDDFRKAMATAGIEMDKMTSLTGEFNQKNNNAPAIIEKIKNAWNDMFTTTDVLNRFEWLIQLVGKITGVTSEAGDGTMIFRNRLLFLGKTIIVLMAAVYSYNAAVWLLTLTTKAGWQQTLIYNAIQKVKIYWDTLGRNTALLYAAAQAYVAGNTLRAAAAMRAFNASASANPIGLLVALIAAAATAYILFSKSVDKAKEKQKMWNDLQADAEKGIVSQKNELELLLKTAKDRDQSDEKRLAAIKKINELSPELLGNIRLENINTQETTNAVNAYTDALLRNSKIKVLNKKLDEVNEKIIDKQKEPITKNGDWIDRNLPFLSPSEMKDLDDNQFKQYDKWLEKGGKKYAKSMMKIYGYLYENKNQALQELQKQSQEFIDNIYELSKTPTLEENNNVVTPTNRSAPEKKKKDKTADQAANDLEKSRAAYNKAVEDYNSSLKKILDANQGFEDEKLKIIEESRLKDISAESLDSERKLSALKQNNIEIEAEIKKSQDNIKNLERDKSTTKSPEAKVNFQNAIDEEEKTNKKRRDLITINNQIEIQLQSTHLYNLAKIHEKWNTAIYEKYVEAEQRRIDESRRLDEEDIINISSLAEAKALLKNNEYLKLTSQELAGIKNLEDAKTALREAADRKMLAAQLTSLETQKKQLENLITSLAEGPAKEALLKNLDELSQKITQVKGAIKGGKEQDSKKVQEESDDEKSKIDILGFSAKDWEETWEKLDTTAGKIEAVKMVVQALGNAFSTFSELQNNLNQKELRQFTRVQDKKKAELSNQLRMGWISQEEYNKKVQLIDAETANKKAQIAHKQAKMERAMKIGEIIVNTSLAIMQAYSQLGPIGGTIAAVLIGTLGAIQLGTAMSAPLPEAETYADGGFTGNGFGKPDKTGFKPAGIVHEREWVAPAWMTEDPRTANVIGYLESVRTGKTKPMADGGFADGNTTTTGAGNSSNLTNYLEISEVLAELKDVLQKIKDEGIMAYILKNAKNGKEFLEMGKMYSDIKDKNKHG